MQARPDPIHSLDQRLVQRMRRCALDRFGRARAPALGGRARLDPGEAFDFGVIRREPGLGA
ncbi:MAG: hypothetical protein IT386_14925 [Deltaproteobacteria bacterium]|nr:hypothetical protein [Deltaproteobacteria bacterium]